MTFDVRSETQSNCHITAVFVHVQAAKPVYSALVLIAGRPSPKSQNDLNTQMGLEFRV